MIGNILFLVLIVSVLSGCIGLNLSLLPETDPLEEKVVEGEGRPKVLLIDLDGMISFKDEKEGLLLKKGPSKVAFFREALLKAGADTDITGVIVKINSPGGSVAASDTIYHEIMSFKKKRKILVYAHIMELGTSGGYYVASAADRIIASPAAITGSIGVVAMKFNMEGLFSKIGISDETFKSGAKKDFWTPFRPSTAEEKKMLQEIIDKLHARFLGVVLSGRQSILTEEEIKALADGRILTADDALEAGLIDQVSYLNETIDTMKKALQIENVRVVTYARSKTFKSNIYSGYPEMSLQGPQTINLISINVEDLALFSGIQFMYLWNP